MLIHIDESDPRALYQQIVDEIRRRIVVGTLSPGEAIPSVRQLAVALRVNPTTVQQAYRELEREGLVFVRRGQGTYVAELRHQATRQERRRLAASVARRALREAQRNGLEADDLIAAIRRIARRVAARAHPSKGGTRT